MQAAAGDRLIARLRHELAEPPTAPPPFTIAADRYRSQAWLAREREALFTMPRVIAASSAIAEPNSCAPIDTAGLSLLLTRGADGRARAFHNACRHRATRLLDASCSQKALVCPYHGWTYDLAGALLHAPHADAFPGRLDDRGLRELPVAERHGLVWLGADIAGYLGGLDADLAALDLDQHVAFRTARVTRRCNWKLVVEAFLDGYHIRILHRDSIYRFFIDAASVAEPAGRHIRAATARRALRDNATSNVRELATPSFLIFPATVAIVHPDFVSLITLHPLAPDATEYEHVMLVPAARAAETDHWARSWALIEDAVFQREDLWVCEQVQRGIASGGTDELLFGALETPIAWFHAAIDACLGA